MFFILSKIFWAIFMPLTFVTFMITGGFLTRHLKWGQRALKASVCMLVAFGCLPIGHNMLVYQENLYPVATELPAKVDGIIVLGGSIDFKKSLARGQGQLNEHAPRITEMVYLMNKYPKAKIVFSGGNGNLTPSESSESIEVDKLLQHMGLNTSRVIYEGKSRNTYENMVFSKEIAQPKSGETWILVTSAFHMARSAAIFNSNGWTVIPYAAGYLTSGEYRLIPNFDVLENMYKLHIAVREMIGIMAYTLTGKIHLNDATNTDAGSSAAPSPEPSAHGAVHGRVSAGK